MWNLHCLIQNSEFSTQCSARSYHHNLDFLAKTVPCGHFQTALILTRLSWNRVDVKPRSCKCSQRLHWINGIFRSDWHEIDIIAMPDMEYFKILFGCRTSRHLQQGYLENLLNDANQCGLPSTTTATSLRTVPIIVIAHMFWASRDTRVFLSVMLTNTVIFFAWFKTIRKR